MKKFNMAFLTEDERDDVELEKRAAMLIQQVKDGKITKKAVKAELLREQDPKAHAKFKSYLNKYRTIE
tara:strand:- start:1421 stop:1624 length:204 start_codon:yes stop_codon:yes gene_type:complete